MLVRSPYTIVLAITFILCAWRFLHSRDGTPPSSAVQIVPAPVGGSASFPSIIPTPVIRRPEEDAGNSTLGVSEIIRKI